MALTERDMQSVYRAIERAIPNNEVTQGKVIRRDVNKRLIWVKEFGDQPIPMVGFKATVKIYDETPTGTKVKTIKVIPEVPPIGATVVVLRQMGVRRLPKCVGMILSTDYVVGE